MPQTAQPAIEQAVVTAPRTGSSSIRTITMDDTGGNIGLDCFWLIEVR